MKKKKTLLNFIFLIVIIALASLVSWPKPNIKVPKPKFTFEKKAPFVKVEKNGYFVEYSKDFPIIQGLDLQGGSHLTYLADLSKIEEGQKDDAMASLKKVIENRVNAFGLAEPQIYTTKISGENRLVAELAGIKDTKQAQDLIGKTAQLEFKELQGENFESTGITGSDFKRADVTFNQSTGAPEISIEFNTEGAKKFSEVTGRNINQPLAIYLDEQLISAPTVNQQITEGRGVITGQFEVKEAKDLAIQLNAGSLPVPIKLIEERTIGASLGQDSINKSIVAGVIAVIFVVIYMIAYYRLLGVFSAIGLFLYLLMTVALIKVFGIVLTMGGVAGLILSVGSSVEDDILVFERIREEMRKGKKFAQALNIGFKKAWPSIMDSSIATLIITAILYSAGGMIRGFAVTLGLGIFVGLATTFMGTRTFLTLISKFKIMNNPLLLSIEKSETTK